MRRSRSSAGTRASSERVHARFAETPHAFCLIRCRDARARGTFPRRCHGTALASGFAHMLRHGLVERAELLEREPAQGALSVGRLAEDGWAADSDLEVRSARLESEIERQKKRSIAPPPTESADPRRSVLIVDDDAPLVETLAAIMEQRYAVSMTTSPLVALNRLEQEDFLVVVSDLHMPGMNGLELLRHAKRLSAGVGCILMTDRIDRLSSELPSEDRKWLAVLSKPFGLDRLFDKVDQLAAVAMMRRTVDQMRVPTDVRR